MAQRTRLALSPRRVIYQPSIFASTGAATMKLAFNIAVGIVLAVLVISFLPKIAGLVSYAVGILWFSGLWAVVLIVGGAVWFLRRQKGKNPDGISKGPWQGKRWL